MKKIQKLLAIAALTSTTAFASVVEIEYSNGATWNSAITGGAKLVGFDANAVLTVGANSSVSSYLELSVGQANVGKSGVVTAPYHIQLATGTQLNVTAAITLDPIDMAGAATINNASNAITLDKLSGSGRATLTGTGEVTLADLSSNSGGVEGVNAVINASTKFPTADSTFTGIATASAAPDAAADVNLTFNEINASYDVGVNDFITSGGVLAGKVLKATKLVLGGNSWAAAVTANTVS